MTHSELKAIGYLFIRARFYVWKKRPWSIALVEAAEGALLAELAGKKGEVGKHLVDIHISEIDEPITPRSFDPFDRIGLMPAELRPFWQLFAEVLAETKIRIQAEAWEEAANLLNLVHEVPADILRFKAFPYTPSTIDAFYKDVEFTGKAAAWRKLFAEGEAAFQPFIDGEPSPRSVEGRKVMAWRLWFASMGFVFAAMGTIEMVQGRPSGLSIVLMSLIPLFVAWRYKK